MQEQSPPSVRPDPVEQKSANLAGWLFAAGLPLASLLSWAGYELMSWGYPELTQGLEFTMPAAGQFVMGLRWNLVMITIPLAGFLALFAIAKNRHRIILSFTVFHIWLLMFFASAVVFFSALMIGATALSP